jgi:hypothetical protein
MQEWVLGPFGRALKGTVGRSGIYPPHVFKGHGFSRADKPRKSSGLQPLRDGLDPGRITFNLQNTIPVVVAVVVGKLESALQLFNFSMTIRH